MSDDEERGNHEPRRKEKPNETDQAYAERWQKWRKEEDAKHPWSSRRTVYG